jgi:hypothetical protein
MHATRRAAASAARAARRSLGVAAAAPAVEQRVASAEHVQLTAHLARAEARARECFVVGRAALAVAPHTLTHARTHAR